MVAGRDVAGQHVEDAAVGAALERQPARPEQRVRISGGDEPLRRRRLRIPHRGAQRGAGGVARGVPPAVDVVVSVGDAPLVQHPAIIADAGAAPYADRDGTSSGGAPPAPRGTAPAATCRDELRVADEQLAHLADEADDLAVRAVVAETSHAGIEARKAREHAAAMAAHRARLQSSIAALEVRQDELLDELNAH